MLEGARASSMGAMGKHIAQQHGASYHEIMRTILPAKARRTTKSSLVRESLKKALHEQRRGGAASCFDLVRDLAGTVKGVPKDLANNPKYMKGFGR